MCATNLSWYYVHVALLNSLKKKVCGELIKKFHLKV